MANKVSLLSVSHVSPSSPTPQPCWKALSTLDQFPPLRFYTKQVYYYKHATDPSTVDHPYSKNFPHLVSELKQSLSITLSRYYPLAGRVQFQKGNDQSAGLLFIDCNDAGVRLHASFSECCLADWSDMLALCSAMDKELIDPAGELSGANITETPIIQVQVTKFRCGSIALGCASLEVAMDGTASYEFFRSWSEMHKTGKMLKLPLFDAELLKPRCPPRVTLPIRDYKAPSSYKNSYEQYLGCPASQLHQTKHFTFTTDKINALINEIGSGPYGSSFQPTSFEAISGLLWKCMTEARELADSDITTYNYSLSLRDNINRWCPRIPTNYCGNAIYLATLQARAGDVKRNHVSYVAWRVHEDIYSISLKTFKSTVDWMQMQMQKGLEIDYNCDFLSGKNIGVTSLHTFPIYDTDFGWGRPVHYSMLLQPYYGDGFALLLPTPRGERSRHVKVACREEHLKKLSAHPLFLAFATPTIIPIT